MKALKFIFIALMPLLLFSCSEDKMDEINAEKNDALAMSANNLLPDVILKSGFETAATDIAWYATVYIEHSAGTWNQSWAADRRSNQNDYSLMNNNWNSLYDVMNICKIVLDRTSADGEEPGNTKARGITEVLMAYNLMMTVDMWNNVPYTEAFLGSDKLQPKYDDAASVYANVLKLLNDGIADLAKTSELDIGAKDIIYGGDAALWTKAANALKARYYIQQTNIDNGAAANAITAAGLAFASSDENLELGNYDWNWGELNPWFEFYYVRDHLSFGKTLYDLMMARTDPRIDYYAYTMGTDIVPAPNGESDQSQGSIYSQSQVSDRAQATPIITYHEVKFIEAEAKFLTGNATWTASLQAAIEANFEYHGLLAVEGTTYYTTSVAPLLTAGNERNEILTQKYIAEYEAEAITAYNDYRRTGVPVMNNPHNSIEGFVNRFPYALSEVSSNSANVPDIDVLVNKVFWAK